MIWIVVCSAILIGTWWFLHRRAAKTDLPGPQGLPLLGNLHQLERGNPYLQLTKWAHQYGSIFKLQLGSANVVVANSYNIAYELYVKKGGDFAGRPPSYRQEVIGDKAMGIVAADPGDQWRHARKIVHTSLKAFGPGMGRIEQLALQMTDDFLETFAKTEGKPIDPKQEIENATIKMISIIVFGECPKEDSEELQQIKRAEKLVMQSVAPDFSGQALDMFPWLRYFGNRVYKDLVIARGLAVDVWNKMKGSWNSTDHISSDSIPVAQAMFESNERLREGQENLFLSNNMMYAISFQLLLAGMTTTTNSLYAFLNILLHHSNVLAKIQIEIDKVLGNKKVGLNHQCNLPYTKAAILELLRYTSIASIGLVHKALCDSFLGGHKITKDTFAIVNLWHIHHDEKFWDEPFEFQPERFLDEEGCLVKADHPNRKHLLPFGAGPRTCVGESVAQARLFLWTVAILQKFDLKPEGNEGPAVPCDPMTYTPVSILKPKPYRIRFVDRHQEL